ncbi:hypothetical protein Naga_100758g1, partial [Nannochloropsis gaditana]
MAELPKGRHRRQARIVTRLCSVALLFCSWFFLFMASTTASSASSSATHDVISTASTSAAAGRAPFAPAVAGWFFSTTSRMTKQEKRGQADMMLQAHEVPPTDRAENPIKALKIIFLSHGKESGMGVAHLFAVTLQTAVTPILRSVGYHLQRLYRALVWALNAGVVDGSRRVGALLVQGLGSLASSLCQGLVAVVELAEVRFHVEGGRYFILPK